MRAIRNKIVPSPIGEQERTLIAGRLQAGETVRSVATLFNRGESQVRGVARGAGLQLSSRDPRDSRVARKQHSVTVEISEAVFNALTAAANRRGAPPENIAACLITGVLVAGNIEATLHKAGNHYRTNGRPTCP